MTVQEQLRLDRRVFSIHETADLLRVSKSLVFKLIRQGKLVPTKIGNRTLITIAEIERLLATPTD